MSVLGLKKKKTRVSANMLKKCMVSRSKFFKIFCLIFICYKKIKNVYWSWMSLTVLENIQIIKLRTYRKLKNVIWSIICAVLIFFKLFVQFPEKY